MLWVCCLLSGAAALALEMLWMRSATLVLGATAQTTAAVLAWTFAGLGLGAAAGARTRRRPARRYALLELGTAAAALWSLTAFAALRADAAQRWLAGGGLLGSAAALGLAVLPAALCLGATLPALGAALAPAATLRARGGLFYAVNTVGGALGIGATGFGLPAAIGVRGSYVAAAAASALAGVLALLTSAGRESEVARAAPARDERVAAAAREDTRRGTPPRPGAAPRARLLVVAAAGGALGLALEVLWTRLFAQVLHNSVYSFSAIAFVFVVMLALGAATAALALRRSDPGAVAAGALALAAGGTLAGFAVFVRSTGGLAYVGMETGLPDYVGRIVALALATAGPAAFASGVVLPALWAAWDETEATARPLGTLGGANMIGAVGGAVGAGFVVAPTVGIRAGLLLAALAYVALAAAVAPRRAWVRWAVAALVLGSVVLNPLRAPILRLRAASETARAVVEGPSGIVSVVESEGDLQLRLDNYYVLGGSAAATSERRLGIVPLLLHPHPRRVAFIGLATGISAGAAPALAVPDTTVVELVPEVAGAARTYFAPWNGGLLERRDVRLVLDDGRRYLQAETGRFDVIVSDLFIPWHAGTSSLYAREMYATVDRRLSPDGIFCQWLPLYQLTREELAIVVRTFLDVFPYATLWRADFYADRPVLGLVGGHTPLQVDLDAAHDRMEHMPAWSRDALLTPARGLAMLYAGDLRASAPLFAAAPLNTDDRPLIEFLAPRLTRLNAAGDKDWFTGVPLADFYDTLASSDASPGPFVAPSPATRDARRAGALLYRYAIAATGHDEWAAAAFESEVRRLVPDVVLAADAAPDSGELADARRRLADLRSAQDDVRRQVEAMQHRLEAMSAAGTP
jgi:spermidine synthase